MTTLVIFGDAADGELDSQNATYATAREGGTLTLVAGGSTAEVGQFFATPNYIVTQGFFAFDTSSASGTIASATLALGVNADQSTTDFTAEARLDDWGATLDTADFVAGSALAGKTLLATLPSLGVGVGAYNTFTDVAFASNINASGFTRIVVASDRQRTATAPPDSEGLIFYTAENPGTTLDPRLTIVITPTAKSDTDSGSGVDAGTIGDPGPGTSADTGAGTDAGTVLAVQIVYPDGDVTVTGWTDQVGGTTTLWATLDEVGVDDTDYVTAVLT